VHEPVVVVAGQLPVVTTVVQPPSSLHDSVPEPQELVDVERTHFIPDAQSESAAQGPGSHDIIRLASHSTTEIGWGHSVPGSHFTTPSNAHDVAPVTWQVNPCWQSESAVQFVAALASRRAIHVPPTNTHAATPI
jgi:hypothetical protein